MRISSRTAVAAVLAASAVAVATPAAAATPASNASAAAGWAGRQLKDGNHVESKWGPDYGLTADIVFALSAAGQGGDTAKAATDYLAQHASSYLTGDTPGDIYAGSTAKLALLAEVQHRDPKSFGGQDLIATLGRRLQPSGRYTDHATFGGKDVSDFSNTFTQSLALLALQRQGAQDVPAKAVEFLTAQQCADGGFPTSYPAKPADCASDADGTGIVVQALLAVGRTAEAGKALDWLEKHQTADGGFLGAGPNPMVNSNSTAFATQALRAGGRTAAAGKGVAWLHGRQIDCAGKPGDRGAVGFLKPEVDDSALRATAQAIPALAGVSLATADGGSAAAGLPVLDCPSAGPSPSASPSAGPTASAMPSATPSAEPTDPASATPAVVPVTDNGALADTGFQPMPPLLLALASVLTGVAWVLFARRRQAPGGRR